MIMKRVLRLRFFWDLGSYTWWQVPTRFQRIYRSVCPTVLFLLHPGLSCHDSSSSQDGNNFLYSKSVPPDRDCPHDVKKALVLRSLLQIWNTSLRHHSLSLWAWWRLEFDHFWERVSHIVCLIIPLPLNSYGEFWCTFANINPTSRFTL